MTILYAALKYDYADTKRGHSFEYNNFLGVLEKKYPGQVHYFPVDEMIMRHGRKGMNKQLLQTVRQKKPEILFTVLYTNEIWAKTIRTITKTTPTITINWFCDDQWRFDNFSRYWAPNYDWVVTTDQNAPQKYAQLGYRNVIKSTWAANTHQYHPRISDTKYGVTFVGAAHGRRKEEVAKLKEKGIEVQCWGSGWPNGRASQEKMLEIFSNSKINLNFTEASTSKIDFKSILKILAKIFMRRGINNTYHFFPPIIIWRNLIHFKIPKLQPQIKGRNFEVPACGGFLLTQPAENLSDYYIFGKQIAIFHSPNELAQKIQYYLNHDAERTAIAKAGFERTLRDHTYEKRFQEVFEKALGGGKKNPK